MTTKQTITVEILHNLGLHLRAAGVIVQTTSNFKAKVTIEYNGIVANGKSIMGILALAAPCGSILEITTEGEDAKACLDTLRNLIVNKFHFES